MDMHSVCVPGAQGGQVLDALKPEIEMIMDHVDAEDWIHVLCKGKKYFLLLSILSKFWRKLLTFTIV